MRTRFASALFFGAALALWSPALRGQPVDSGSSGSDGALAFAAGAGTILFDPAGFTPRLDPDGDGVYHFTTITIPAGTTVRLRADILGEGRPVVWLASGAVEIAGTIDLDGEGGHASTVPPRAALAGAGGFHGGPGGAQGSVGQAGNGPGGGVGGRLSFGSALGGHAGHLTAGLDRGSVPGGAAYGNRYLLPLEGGSGGGGSSNEAANSNGGGAGGGAVLIASSVSIDVTGSITARGGAGGGPTVFGGHGSGGSIRLVAPTVSGTGSLAVNSLGAFSGAGIAGRVRIERLLDRFTGTIQPTGSAVFSSPGSIFPPASAPRLRIRRVGASDVPANPTGGSVAADVTVDSAESLTIEIEAANVPVGTRVRLRIVPEEGDETTVDSTPLAGTLASSTASAQATFASGLSKIFISADWGA